MSKKEENNVSKGLMWTFAERITAQLVSTIVTIILARILEPSHYGIISIVVVFISLCNIFATSGFGSAVVQKKNATEVTFNTAFILSMTIGIVLYIIIYCIAPEIANFYKMTELVSVIRVMGLRIPLAAVNTIQQAKIQRDMKFKKFFIVTSIGTTISAFVGIALAYNGLGVWALVAQYLTNTTIDTVSLLLVGGWKPKIQFSKEEAKSIFSFGWKVLLTDLVFTLENDIRSLIIGKVFGSSDLAFYDQGKKYPSLIVTNINSSINKVMLPAYSKQQNDLDRLKEMLRKSIKIGVFLLAPILIGFACVSENFVHVILTDKWIFAAPYIQIFCIAYLTRPLEASCHQGLLAIGRSDLVLYIMIAVNIFALGTVLISVFIFKSVFLIALGSLLTAIISLMSFMIMSWKFINYTPKEQLRDILPTLIISFIMGMIVILIGKIDINPIYELILQILFGGIVYILISRLFKVEAFVYLKEKIVSKIKYGKIERK